MVHAGWGGTCCIIPLCRIRLSTAKLALLGGRVDWKVGLGRSSWMIRLTTSGESVWIQIFHYPYFLGGVVSRWARREVTTIADACHGPPRFHNIGWEIEPVKIGRYSSSRWEPSARLDNDHGW
jgi:hypothetical protein